MRWRQMAGHHLRGQAACELQQHHAVAGAGGEKRFREIVINLQRWYDDNAIDRFTEVMHRLHWTTLDGCSSRRPGLNYCLLCAPPGEYVDHQQSCFVNERLHARIQKDKTYFVVPRM